MTYLCIKDFKNRKTGGTLWQCKVIVFNFDIARTGIVKVALCNHWISDGISDVKTIPTALINVDVGKEKILCSVYKY